MDRERIPKPRRAGAGWCFGSNGAALSIWRADLRGRDLSLCGSGGEASPQAVASALDKGGAERVTRLYRHIAPTKNKRPVPILASRTKFSSRPVRFAEPNGCLFLTGPFFGLLILLPLTLLD